MASYKTTLKKKTNNDILYPQTTADIVSTGTSNVETVLNNQEARIASLEAQATKNKGYFETEQLLLTAYPNNIPDPSVRNGWYAIVGNGTQQQATMYVWDLEDNEWVNTGVIEYQGVASVNGILPNEVGEVTVTGANINATANLETKSVDNHLQSLYTEIDEVIENSGRVQQLDFTGTLENNVWTFTPTVLADITLADLNENNLYELNLHSSVVGTLNNTDTMLLQIEGITINIATMFTTGDTATVAEMVQVFREDNELGHQWTFNAMYNEKTVDSVTVRAFTIQPTVNDIPQNVKDTITELENQTNVKYLTSEEMLNAIDTNTYEDGQTAVCITNDGYELGHLYKFKYSTTSPVTYEWVDITAGGSGGLITEIIGTQDDPIVIDNLENGLHILKGFVNNNEYGISNLGTTLNNLMIVSTNEQFRYFFCIGSIYLSSAGLIKGESVLGNFISIQVKSLDGTTTYDVSFVNPSQIAQKGEVLLKNEVNAYVPTGDYNPATKIYVDSKPAIIDEENPSTITSISYKNKIATSPNVSETEIYYYKQTSDNIFSQATANTGYPAIKISDSFITSTSYNSSWGQFVINTYDNLNNPWDYRYIYCNFQQTGGVYKLSRMYNSNGEVYYDISVSENEWLVEPLFKSTNPSAPFIGYNGNDTSQGLGQFVYGVTTPAQVTAIEIAQAYELSDKLEATNILAGDNITVSRNGNNVTINSTGGGGGAVPPTFVTGNPLSTFLKVVIPAGNLALPLATGNYNYEINKGDGSEPVSYTTGGLKVLNYTSAGVYWIELSSADGTTLPPLTIDSDSPICDYVYEIYIGAKHSNYGTINNCQQLYKVYFNESSSYPIEGVTELPQNALFGNTLLSEINLPQTITTIGSSSFANCEALHKIHLPNSITTIQSGAFINCYSLEEIILPYELTTITSSCFSSCYSLRKITIPNNITTINDSAFNLNFNLNEVIFERTSTFTIGNKAFYKGPNTGKAKYIFNTPVPPTISTNTFNQSADFEVYVPSGSLTAYQTATNWSTISSKIKEIALVNNLGTASSVDIGTSSGNVPVIGNDGKLDSSIIPSSGGGSSSLETLYYNDSVYSGTGLPVALAATGYGSYVNVDLSEYLSATDGYKGYVVCLDGTGGRNYVFTLYVSERDTTKTFKTAQTIMYCSSASEVGFDGLCLSINRTTGIATFDNGSTFFTSANFTQRAPLAETYYIQQIWGIK